MDKVGDIIIRKRNGKYEYKFEIDPLDGKRRWKSRGGFSLKREAVQAGNQAREEYIKTNGKPARKQDNISFNALSELYLERVLNKYEPTTYTVYKTAFKKYFCPAFGKMPVRNIDYKDIEDLFRQILDLELSTSRVCILKTILNETFAFAVKPLRVINENPVELADLVLYGIEEKGRIPYTKEQIHLILDTVPMDSPYRIVLILGIFCGMRIGEILGLTWDCVDFEHRTITINKQMANISYDHKLFRIIKKPKSKKSIRVLCFGEAVEAELKQLKEREEKEKQLLGSEYLKPQTELLAIQQKKVDRIVNACSVKDGNTEFSLVCRKHDGGYIQSRSVDAFMKSLSKKVGFHCTSHISRHTHATLLLEEGANIANISARLGHNGTEVTMQYLHSRKDADYDISNRIENTVLSTK